MILKGIRLKNIRSLADTGMIRLRPITLLLGQNSSGKSTVLRSLPLISQSVKTRANAPILWFGDYVDFGSVHEVRSNFARDEAVSIELDFGITNVVSRHAYENKPRMIPLALSIDLHEIEDRTRLRSFSITCKTDVLKVTFDSRGTQVNVSVNDRDYTKLLPSERFRFVTSEFVPQITIRPSADSTSTSFFEVQRRIDTAEREIRRILSSRLHGRISEGTITALSRRVRYLPDTAFSESLSDIPTPLKSWRTLIGDLMLAHNRPQLESLRELSLIASLPDILFTLERRLSLATSNIAYVGPSRATGERYYRIQELAIDQIDPQGKNLPMFLHSLSAPQLRSFSEWLLDSVGYAIRVERSSGHVQIQLRSALSEKFYNLADMGYGFSQVLPIMAQIWSRFGRRGQPRRGSAVVVMEQPELHLHPAYQARLADVLAKAIGSALNQGEAIRPSVSFVVETHSESLINRMGDLISQGALSKNDVALYIFEKGLDDDITKISPVEFDDEGVLNNWPIGFFSPRL